MISTGMYGVPRQGIWPNSASAIRVNTLERAATAPFENRGTGPHHVRSIRVVAGELQRVVRLHRTAHVEVAAVVQRPAAVFGLLRAKIDGQLLFERSVDLIQKVHHHDVLGWNGAVGLEFEQPVALCALSCDQGIARLRHRPVQRR